MTDEQILFALAEKVMGWKHTPGKVFAAIGEFSIFTMGNHLTVMVNDGEETKGGSTNNWNPLYDDSDAFAVLDKLGADGFRIEITYLPYAKVWHCHMFNARTEKMAETQDPDRRRATSTASLMAMGAWAE